MNERSLRIALVLATPGTIWGGMEKHTLELAGALAELGHNVDVFGDERYQNRFAAPVQFHALPVHLGRRNPWLCLKLKRALAGIQPDIVHAQGAKAAQLVGRAEPSGAKPWITLGTVHGIKSRHSAYQQLNGVIAVSDEIAATLIHARVRRIYNGTTLATGGDRLPLEQHSHPLTLAVGRLEPVKGFDHLLVAWAESGATGHLTILGEGSERHRLEQLRQTLGLEQTVTLGGYQADVSKWYRSAHCCVISSSREALPYVLVEALLADCPVLATPVGRTAHFLPRDCIARSSSSSDLALLLKQKHNTDLKQQQASAFKMAKAELTLEAMAEQTLDFYQVLLDAPQKQSIELDNSTPFASGYNRHCYIHPDDPDTCLKIIRPDHLSARFRRQRWYKKILGSGRLDDNRQEQQAYQQPALGHSSAQVWAHLPRLWGSLETSRGLANASELLRDADGNPAPTLETALKTTGLTESLTGAINRFSHWLTETGILTRNLLPHNLVVVERDGQPELYLIDGLGAPPMARQLSHIPAWRKRYIRRRIQRFWLRIEWELGNRMESWEQAQRIR